MSYSTCFLQNLPIKIDLNKPTPFKRGTPEHLVDFLVREYQGTNYLLNIRILPDGEVAMLVRLMYTHAICMRPDYTSVYERRYCFQDKALAKLEFEKLTSGEEVPTGWIATRPEPPGFYELK